MVRRMWLRMDRLPDSLGLSLPHSGERVALLGYLEENALRVSGATLPAGTGRDEFAMICSPIGSPSTFEPQGIEMPAIPARFAEMV